MTNIIQVCRSFHCAEAFIITSRLDERVDQARDLVDPLGLSEEHAGVEDEPDSE